MIRLRLIIFLPTFLAIPTGFSANDSKGYGDVVINDVVSIYDAEGFILELLKARLDVKAGRVEPYIFLVTTEAPLAFGELLVD